MGNGIKQWVSNAIQVTAGASQFGWAAGIDWDKYKGSIRSGLKVTEVTVFCPVTLHVECTACAVVQLSHKLLHIDTGLTTKFQLL